MTEGLDGAIETFSGDRDYYPTGKNLAADERGVIDPRDTWFVSLIRDLPEDELVKIGNCFKPFSMKHYLEVQKKWFSKEKELLYGRLRKEPNSDQLIDDARRYKNMERFRLCYVLEFPHKVKFNFDIYNRNRYDADAFLALAEMNHRIPYPYFVLIAWNSLLVNTSIQTVTEIKKE